jgi:hypothetical protein
MKSYRVKIGNQRDGYSNRTSGSHGSRTSHCPSSAPTTLAGGASAESVSTGPVDGDGMVRGAIPRA